LSTGAYVIILQLTYMHRQLKFIGKASGKFLMLRPIFSYLKGSIALKNDLLLNAGKMDEICDYVHITTIPALRREFAFSYYLQIKSLCSRHAKNRAFSTSFEELPQGQERFLGRPPEGSSRRPCHWMPRISGPLWKSWLVNRISC
jgi:hypothetical protein